MSIDAIALLNVSAARAKRCLESPEHVIRLGPDACGVMLFERHDGLDVAMARAAAFVRSQLGSALGLHADPRGVLIYPEVAEPRAAKYEDLVPALEDGAFWVPRDLLDSDDDALAKHDEEDERDGGFLERIGALVEREGGARRGAIIAADLHQTKPTEEDIRRLCSIATLRALDLRHVVTLTRSGLAAVAAMPALESLTLDELKITDDDLALFVKAKRLTRLSVAKTRICGTGFARLARLPAFRELRMGYTPLDDDGLAAIAALPRLEILRLAPSNVTDAGVARIAAHPRLRILDASRTRITDAIVPALLEAPSLERVSLRATAVTEGGIARLKARPGLDVEV